MWMVYVNGVLVGSFKTLGEVDRMIYGGEMKRGMCWEVKNPSGRVCIGSEKSSDLSPVLDRKLVKNSFGEVCIEGEEG